MNRLSPPTCSLRLKPLVALLALALAAQSESRAGTVQARYLRFDGYYSADNGQINLYEIEAYAGSNNVARGSISVTTNSGTGANKLIDGNKTSNHFSTNRSSPGQPSKSSPHRVQFDFGSIQPVDKIKVYTGNHLISFGLFSSQDGLDWTCVGVANQVNKTTSFDPSAPIPVVLTASMRPGSSYMDIQFVVWDLDDTTVKIRPLAFIAGIRSFANVIRPTTFAEGTAANIGDAVAANTTHTLTWDVGADWDVDLGQVKFEVIAQDARPLIEIDWINIPQSGEQSALTISRDTASNQAVLDALLWLYACKNHNIEVTNGSLSGSPSSGEFSGVPLVEGANLKPHAFPMALKVMNLGASFDYELRYALTTSRSGIKNASSWHAIQRPSNQIQILYGVSGPAVPAGLNNVAQVDLGRSNGLALTHDGVVSCWGSNSILTNIPPGITNIVRISAGEEHNLALSTNGTVYAWGSNSYGESNVPEGLTNVVAIAAGVYFSVALMNNGAVTCWGSNSHGQRDVPAWLGKAVAIDAGAGFCLALKDDQTIVGWGQNDYGQIDIPAGLTNVVAISAGIWHSMALKSDGTVVAWGINQQGQRDVPIGLDQVRGIRAGYYHSLAILDNGSSVLWGNSGTPLIVPAGFNNIVDAAVGFNAVLLIKGVSP